MEKIEQIDPEKILFYDLETDHKFAPYAKIKLIGVQYGLHGKPELVKTEAQESKFRRYLGRADIHKVSFNGVNFDNIVLANNGYRVHERRRQDMFIAAKVCAPALPAYSLKFINFYYFSDPHFPEMEVEIYMAQNRCAMHQVPPAILDAYNKHDIVQLKQTFLLFWDVITRPEFWTCYRRDMDVSLPLQEIELEGGLYINSKAASYQLHLLEKIVMEQTKEAIRITGGRVTNANSSQQLAKYFTEEERLELAITETGQFSVSKSLLVDLKDTNELANCAYKIRKAQGTAKYFRNYLQALQDESHVRRMGRDWLPIQISLDAARTRRFTSQSLYKLNFQNPNEEAKKVQSIPFGFLGVFLDATQIENVVHIYESEDSDRRAAYEADPNWNEYVWLANTVLGTKLSKDELDKIPSKQVPNWSVYKQYKTGKLGLNFGMGLDLFCRLFGLDQTVGQSTLDDIHEACPAIRGLQKKVAETVRRQGYVQDAFGYRYSGFPTHKLVAYLIQGCGTGSLPKAQILANWRAIRGFDVFLKGKGRKCGLMSVPTHDDQMMWIRLDLGPTRGLQLLQRLMWNMTERFSPMFDDIPLRAKLYLSRTTVADKEEVSIDDHAKIKRYFQMRD